MLEGDDAPRVGVELVSVAYDDGETETYQVPLAYYAEEQERLAHALVGTWHDEDLGTVHAYDAVHDREATDLLAARLRRARPRRPTGRSATAT